MAISVNPRSAWKLAPRPARLAYVFNAIVALIWVVLLCFGGVMGIITIPLWVTVIGVCTAAGFVDAGSGFLRGRSGPAKALTVGAIITGLIAGLLLLLSPAITTLGVLYCTVMGLTGLATAWLFMRPNVQVFLAEHKGEGIMSTLGKSKTTQPQSPSTPAQRPRPSDHLPKTNDS